MKIGQVIRCYRLAAGYMSKDFAEACNLSPTYMSEIENMKKLPNLKLLSSFASVLKVPASTIMNISELAEEGNWDFKRIMKEVFDRGF